MKLLTPLHSLKQYITSNLVIKGTLILTIAGFSTRMIGFYNRIFLSGLIGATQIGIYQLILPLYMVAFALTNYGNELALTKLVSEYKGRNDYASIQSFFQICFSCNLVLGVITSVLLYHHADWICIHLLNAPECVPCVQIICLGVPFMSMKGAIHGFFLGLEKSSIHGISDFIEQAFKVLSLLLISNYICIRNDYDAAFALWGVVIGDVVAFLFSIAALRHHQHKNKNLYQTQKTSIYPRQILSLFFKNSVPLTTNRLALTVLQSIESIMIPTVLLIYYKDSSASLAHYGTFTGMAFPFIMFPSTITNALSTMLLPAVSSAQSTLNRNYLTNLCEKSMHFCLTIGFFSFVSFYMFGNEIGMFFFQNKEAGIYLYQLSFLCPLIYIATTLASILNGLGFATANLLFTGIATIIRISFIQFAIPQLGMTGYIIGLFASYLFLTFACLYKVQKQINFELHFLDSIFLPCCTFTVLGSIIYYLYQRLTQQITFERSGHVILLITTIMVFGIISIPLFLRTIYKVRQQPH